MGAQQKSAVRTEDEHISTLGLKDLQYSIGKSIDIRTYVLRIHKHLIKALLQHSLSISATDF
jgi:hypothetical protein